MTKTLTLIAALLAAPALAHDYTVGDLSIAHPYAMATPPNAPVGGGYLEITNTGMEDDTLIAASVAPEVAGMVQLHEMAMEDGVMLMSEVEGGIPVPAGETVMLERGGLHVMFMQLPQGLAEGTEIPATLTFEKAGEVEVVFTVEDRATVEALQGGAGGHGGDHSSQSN